MRYVNMMGFPVRFVSAEGRIIAELQPDPDLPVPAVRELDRIVGEAGSFDVGDPMYVGLGCGVVIVARRPVIVARGTTRTIEIPAPVGDATLVVPLEVQRACPDRVDMLSPTGQRKVDGREVYMALVRLDSPLLSSSEARS